MEGWTANPARKGKEGPTARGRLSSMSQIVQAAILSSPEENPASRKRRVSTPERGHQRRELGFTTVNRADRCMNGAESMSGMQRSSRRVLILSSIGCSTTQKKTAGQLLNLKCWNPLRIVLSRQVVEAIRIHYAKDELLNS